MAAFAFAVTNVDDLFLLVAWFAAGRLSAPNIVLGQSIGLGALVAISLLVSLPAAAIPASYLPLLGIAPIALAFCMLRRPWPQELQAPSRSGLLAVAAATVANGADNLNVYIPLFATSDTTETLAICAVFAAMTAAWCLAAYSLVRHPSLGAPLRRWGPRATPWALIAIGVWIMFR